MILIHFENFPICGKSRVDSHDVSSLEMSGVPECIHLTLVMEAIDAPVVCSLVPVVSYQAHVLKSRRRLQSHLATFGIC